MSKHKQDRQRAIDEYQKKQGEYPNDSEQEAATQKQSLIDFLNESLANGTIDSEAYEAMMNTLNEGDSNTWEYESDYNKLNR